MREQIVELAKLHIAALEILAEMLDEQIAQLVSDLKAKIIDLERPNLENIPPLRSFFGDLDGT